MAFHIGCDEHDLDQFIENDYNVLFEGLHGTGKTSIILQAFERHFGEKESFTDEHGNTTEKYRPGKMGEDFMYLSAPTLDPWVDLVGVPHVGKRMIQGEMQECLELLRPYNIVKGNIKGIYIDEYNRSPKKVRNAVMELIQFKSINGFRFPNLRVVWVAINPDDDVNMDFDVEPIDPAQRDRFHIQIQIPYEPSEKFFTETYGNETSKAAIDWWKSLPQEVKLEVSPRRLEYAIQANMRGVNLRFLLPKASNPQKLHQSLKNGIPEERFRKLMAENNVEEAKKWLAKSSNLDAVQKIIVAEDTARKFALPLIDTERLSGMLAKTQKIKDEILNNPYIYKELIRELANGAQNEKLKSDCQKILKVIEQSAGPEPVGKLNLDIKPLPNTITKREIFGLRTNYRLAEETVPTLANAKNANSEPLCPAFTGKFEDEARNIARFCNISATNTYYRGQLIDNLAKLSTKPDMTEEEVTACLRFFEFFASHSNTKSVYSNSLASLVFNTLVLEYRKHKPLLSSKELYDLIPNVYYRYFGENVERNDEFHRVISNLILRPKPKEEQVNPIEDDDGSFKDIVI